MDQKKTESVSYQSKENDSKETLIGLSPNYTGDKTENLLFGKVASITLIFRWIIGLIAVLWNILVLIVRAIFESKDK